MSIFKENSRYRGATVTQVSATDGSLRDYVVLRKPLNVPLNTEDVYIELDQNNEKRPDLISYQAYGTVDFGWAIMEVNSIRSFLDLTSGTRLRLPPVELITTAVQESNG